MIELIPTELIPTELRPTEPSSTEPRSTDLRSRLQGLWLPLVTPFRNGEFGGASAPRPGRHFRRRPGGRMNLRGPSGRSNAVGITGVERVGVGVRSEILGSK